MKKTYRALIGIALGKSTITPPNPLPNDVKPELLEQLLNNGSIEEVQPTAADLKAEAKAKADADEKAKAEADAKAKAEAKMKADAEAQAKAALEVQANAETQPQIDSPVKADTDTETQPVKEVSELSVADLKAKAGELGIKGFANMSKASLIKAIADASQGA